MYKGNQPTTLSPRFLSEHSDEGNIELEVSSIIKSQSQPRQHQQILQVLQPVISQNLEDNSMEELQLQMLVQQCEELISKISPFVSHSQETTLNLELEESTFTMKKQKQRLEKQYIDLCLQIQRQQKQLHNYKFKVQVAHKQAEYYTRQIKQKTEILKNLEQHQTKKKKK